MKNYLLPALLFFMLPFLQNATAQDIPAKPKSITPGTFIGVSKRLGDLPPMTKEEYQLMLAKAKKKEKNTPWSLPVYPFASTALPKGPDAAWQKNNGTRSNENKAPLVNVNGQSSPYYPPDCNGTAGPNHYMQTVNTTYAIYNKSGVLVAGPSAMNTLFGNVTGANNNDGDPIILYDEQASRWVAVEFSISGSNDYMLIAVSTTSDPTGTWNQYSFDVVDMPDYEKLGVWRDGYYMGTNTQPTTGSDIYVFERSQMLIGGFARMVAFDNPYRPGTGVVVVPPVDNDGPAAPEGAPGTFIAFNDDGVGAGTDQLWLFELDVDWTTPANSTFNRTQQLDVTPFDSQFSNGWDNIPQKGSSMKLCAISSVIMNVPQYRNFGDYQSIVCCHTVDVDGTDHAGVRWYELRKTPPATTWTIRQQGTYAPDAHSRWMGTVAMNGSNKIGVGYSLSSSTEFPGIRYAGQSAANYASASGELDVPEVIAHAGTNFQYTYNRWGDYASMSIDPVDDQTFWFTTQYIGTSEARKTKIISFIIGNNPVVATLASTAITGTTATLNGTVNPNGLETTYSFEWGTNIGYGNSTTFVSAGSGSSNVIVNADITGLTAGATYHFRLTATNSDGTTNGRDLTFIPGGVTISSTAATAIGLTTATAGGTVVADGGYPVTARGICWSTSANPAIDGSHTTDGSGLGVFTSSITELLSSTTYHFRAYATNATGTYYGEDMTFTTLCDIFALPFAESFSNTIIPNCWSQVDHQGNGQVWQFGTITGQSPNPVLTGNYAYLDSDGYGSGTSQNADLLTPTLDLTGYSSVNLQFKHYFKSYSGSSASISYSINNGTTWTLIQQFTSNSVTNPATFNQAIAAVAGQPLVKFKWNYTGTYGYSWSIDNISITGVSSGMLVSPSNQNVTSTAGTTPFAVTTHVDWTASSNAQWCTVTPTGTGNGTLTATYTANLLPLQRVANITATGTGFAPVVVTVTQAAAPATLAVTPAEQNMPAEAGNTSFDVTSNSTWNVISNQAWCSVTPSGNGDGAITAACAENLLVTSRTANITVTVVGLTPIVVSVSQAGALPILTVTPSALEVTASAGDTTLAVTSNTDWTVASDQTWCTVDLSGTGNETIAVIFEENLLITPRVAIITATVEGLEPVIVSLTQAGALPTLTVTPLALEVTASAGDTTLAVTSNTDWTVASDQLWCTGDITGTGDGTLTLIYTENLTVLQRIANITVTVSGLTPVVVTVSQQGAAPLLSLTPANQDGSEFAGAVEYAVTSNTDWTASSDSAWCLVTASGSGNGTIVANYQTNPYYGQRIATISVNVAGLPAQSATLTQATSTVSVPDFGVNGISLFPNPARGLFTLVVEKSRYPVMEVSIINPAGVKILTRKCKGESEYHFDLSGMPQGCYFVKIKTATEVITKELVIIK